MGYFSNGSEGMDYEEQYCVHCVHMQDEPIACPILKAHLLWNYDECNNKDSLLHKMIPRSVYGENLECVFFDKRD